MIIKMPGVGHRGLWMQSFRGRAFYPNDPKEHEIHIEDIAHALSLQCRYGGHCERFYSVAEHSYWLSYMVEDEFAGLMHDSPEAYLMDIPTPEKVLLKPAYHALEAGWWKAIAQKFGLVHDLPPDVLQADADICFSERDANMKATPAPWRLKECGFRIRIKCWSPRKAEKMFLLRFRELHEEQLSWYERLQLAMNRLTYTNNKKLQEETFNAAHRYRSQGARG